MSHEDYIEAIVMLAGNTQTSVRSVDVAAKLGVSKVSVNKALIVLKDRGYVEQSRYGGIVLTKEGLEYGQSVLERHNLLITFLTKAIGIDEGQAEKEACLMEHAISDDSFMKWKKFIQTLNL